MAGKTIDRRNAVIMKFNIRNKEAKELKRGVNSAIRNEKAGKPNEDAKVDLEIQLKEDSKSGFEV